MADGELSDLIAAGLLAHGRADDADGQVGAGRPRANAAQRGLDDFVEGKPLLHVLFRSKAKLGVHHAVLGEILGGFMGRTLDGVGGLGDADGVGERFEIELELVAVSASTDPSRQFVDVGGREAGVASLGGELNNGLGTHAAVEVIVEQHLRRLDEDLWCKFSHATA